MVTDAFGGTGGIACYNRDLVAAVSDIESVEGLLIVPRDGKQSTDSSVIHQTKGHRSKLLYSAMALIEAWRFRPDRIFCGHLYMLPLATLIGRMIGVPVWLQLHGIEAWQPPSRLVIRALRRVDYVS